MLAAVDNVSAAHIIANVMRRPGQLGKPTWSMGAVPAATAAAVAAAAAGEAQGGSSEPSSTMVLVTKSDRSARPALDGGCCDCKP